MEGIVIFIIFIVFSIIRSVAENQKRQQRTDAQDRPVLSTPRGEGENPAPRQPSPYLANLLDTTPAAERPTPQRERPSRDYGRQKQAPPMQEPSGSPVMKGFLSDKNDLIRGVVLSELLGPPRAFRRGRRPTQR